jgi:hypothetical protein
VFVGKDTRVEDVTRVTREGDLDVSWGTSIKYTFEIKESWKGPKRTIVLLSQACDISFESGRSYVVFANRLTAALPESGVDITGSKMYRASVCSPSEISDTAKQKLESLRSTRRRTHRRVQKD